MRKLLVLLIIVVIFPAFSLVCYGDDGADKYLSDFEKILPEEMCDGASDAERLQEMIGFQGLVSELALTFDSEKGRINCFFLILLGCLVLLALASTFSGSLGKAVSCAVGTVTSTLIFSTVFDIYDSVSYAVGQANDFFVALIPITVGITSLGGGELTAGVQATGMSVTAALLSKIWGVFFTAVSGLGLSMSLISAYGGTGCVTVSRWVKKSFSWVMGIVTAIISGTISLQTMVSSARDCAAMRAAKYAASGMIPAVGSTVSGALATLASGISYVKGIVGGGSVLVILSILLSPLVLMLLYRFAFSFVSFVSEFFEISVAEKIFGSYLYSLDTVIITYTLSGIVYLFEIILFVKSGVALL